MPGSEERPQAHELTSALDDAAVALDAAGRVTGWNDAAARRSGIPAGAVGLAVAEVVPAPHLAEATRLELADGGSVLVWAARRPLGDDDVAIEKARILERLAPGVAHDLINQVGGIQGFLQVLDGADAHDRAMLDETATRAMDTVMALQGLVRGRLAGRASMPVATLVADSIALCAHPLAEVAVAVDVSDALPDVVGEPVHLRQALLAVLVSAMDALGWPAAKGSIRVSARATDRGVEIAIEDDGPAIATDAVDGLFELAAGPMAGRDPLDLAVARHLLRLEGGDLVVAPRSGGGNRLVLTLPAGGETSRVGETADEPGAGEPSVSDPSPAPAPDSPSARTVVLVCDDEPSVRSLVVRVLRRAGLDAAEAATGHAALDAVETGRVSAVVADHHLGTMTGLELYTLAVASDPTLRGRFVLMSGDPGDGGLAEFARANGLPVVAKPFADLNQLAALVRDLPAG